MKEIIINKNDSGQKLEKFLFKTLNSIPASLLYKYFRNKCIKLNGKKCTGKETLCEGDVLRLFIKDEFYSNLETEHKENANLLTAARLNIESNEIVYEDENILLINKRAGETVHSGNLQGEKKSSDELYLIDRILGYLYKKGEYSPETEQSFTPALCNRIDKNTSGIVITAKNSASLRILNQKIKDRELSKSYLCVCYGEFEKREDTLCDFHFKDSVNNRVYIFKSAKDAKKMFPKAQNSDIKEVITKYKVLKTKDDLSLLEVELVTGRTHQIRAHLAFYGHPLLGDGKYGKARKNDSAGTKQLLHSHKLTFNFSTDAGILQYLDGETFITKQPQFVEKYF